MIPHKSRKFHAILDLSFKLHLICGKHLLSVNVTTTLMASMGATDQMGQALSQTIHTLVETDNNAVIFMENSTSKMAFCTLIAWKAKNGILPMCPTATMQQITFVVPTGANIIENEVGRVTGVLVHSL